MFTVMLFMIAGFCLGLVLRRKRMPFIARFVTILVWLLLFLLGVEVGGNPRVVGSLGSLGVEAIVLALSGVLGSALLCKVLFRKEGKQ